MNTVTIDIGNSSTKIEFWADNGFLFRESCGNISIDKLILSLERYSVRGIIISSVKEYSENLIKSLKEKTDCLTVVFNNEEIQKYYSLSHYNSNVGPDRIAAVLGANVLCPDISKLVIDLGTAITLDLVDKKGIFCGGNISLGLFSRLKSLYSSTDKLPYVDNLKYERSFGEDTVSAIEAGARNGVVGEILYTIDLAIIEKDIKLVVVTGGDAKWIYPFIQKKIEGLYDPYLVGRGLDHHLRTFYLN